MVAGRSGPGHFGEPFSPLALTTSATGAVPQPLVVGFHALAVGAACPAGFRGSEGQDPLGSTAAARASARIVPFDQSAEGFKIATGGTGVVVGRHF